LLHQESKLAASGLGEYFWRVAVVADKTPDTYRRILDDNGVDLASFLMVGNSVRSDVLPVIEIGGRAAHVPFHLEWAHEAGDPIVGHDCVWNLTDIRQVLPLLESLDSRGGSRRRSSFADDQS
jgi:FMN phosphatase YigB (HAD superfamily)